MPSLVTGTNIDVNGLVTQLVTAERAPLTAMRATQTGFEAKISAFGKIRSSLSSLGDAAARLDSSSTYKAMGADVGDATIAGASVAAGAAPGTYSVEVRALAQSQKLASNRYTASSAAVGSGTMSIEFGSYDSGANLFTANPAKASLAVTIASGSTLEGVRDAINLASTSAGAGVRARIINDGVGYRLSVSSADTGLANGLRISVADGDGGDSDTAGLSALAYDPAGAVGTGKNLIETSAAKDALLTIDGVAITKSNNTVNDAIAGVSLTLKKTNIGSPTSLTVARDDSAIRTALDGMVKAYNSFNTTTHDLTFYDASNRTAGTLQGDAAVRSMQSQVRTAILGNGGAGLSSVGLSLRRDGSLTLDSAKFSAAAADPGFDFEALFGATGRSNDTRVQFSGASSTLAAGSYAIAVSTPAASGKLSGNAAANTTITTGVNDVLSLTIDGTATSVTLAAGSYSPATLATELQTRLNTSSALSAAGKSVTVSQSAGVLGVTSNSAGSVSAVTATGGSAAADLFGPAPASTAGSDVAGTVNGETATGSGTSLVSAGGLRLTIASSATGSLGSVTFARGGASTLRNAISGLLDASGPLSARTDGLSASVKRVQKQQDNFNVRVDALELRYRAQFTALDAAMSSMRTTSSFLTQQLAALANLR